ncbi:MAG TPA: hypothetical protein VJ260_06115 [Vicinamibacterales bacterium]|jgi:hypothetical protein|nr:hypothetical protein [Vicinamibacterales bacterium]
MTVRRSIVALLALVVTLGVGITVGAQMKRPYHNGAVYQLQFIRVKPGMESAYLSYLAGPWKKMHEAGKQAGLEVSYKVISTESHGTGDFNLILLTEVKSLANLEMDQDKVEELMQKVVGNDDAQMQGYKDRAEIREVIGARLAREVVLEPKM